eukprot:1194793-Prorocentrum_minimum.AAC.3
MTERQQLATALMQSRKEFVDHGGSERLDPGGAPVLVPPPKVSAPKCTTTIVRPRSVYRVVLEGFVRAGVSRNSVCACASKDTRARC